MRFYSLDKKILKTQSNEVKLKVEYFWHFWEFLFTSNRDFILIEEPKITSHITLLRKVEKHLTHNNRINAKKLLKYSEHDYFKKDNLILRSDIPFYRKVKKLKSLIQNFKDDRTEILDEINVLKSIIFNIDDYSNLLIHKFKKIIFSNKNLESVRSDLKFLCNSIIDILIIRGYSIEFTRSLLKNIIFNPNGSHYFKYEKKYLDFDNQEDYQSYVRVEYKKITIEDRINYLSFFLTQPQKKGFHFFKIEGINFNYSPIDILGVKFYNPIRDSFLSFFKTDFYKDEVEKKEIISRRELFHSEHEIYKNIDSIDSNCNAIVPVNYFEEDLRYDTNKEVPESYRRAIDKVGISLSVLKNSVHLSSKSYWEKDVKNIKPSLASILTDIHYHYRTSCNIDEENKIDFDLDAVREKMLNERLSFINSIVNKNNFLIQLSKSHSAINNYKLDFYFFDFKSIWIECVEPFFNDYSEFIETAKKVVLYRTNIFSNYQSLLNDSLNNYLFMDNYYIDKKNLINLGISELKIGQILDGIKIKKNYHLLPEFSVLSEFKNEIKNYKTSKDKFQERINSWITITIQKAYDERNIEAHYNLKDFYIDYTLKRDLIKIVSITIGAFTDAVYANKVLSVDEAHKYIDNQVKSE